eukprot:TRINITY_DN30_c0_g1_i3.p1 TRINITY_DN30_c0_g1~~TRINITY_DN30_c0_g1_i3.p1  ORF type:complete len:272 (-),score=18.91 TRINITY_DN30_c0_g1_i3:106-831(-)
MRNTLLVIAITAFVSFQCASAQYGYQSFDAFWDDTNCTSPKLGTAYLATDVCYGDGQPSWIETCNGTQVTQRYCHSVSDKCSNCTDDYTAPTGKCTTVNGRWSGEFTTVFGCYRTLPVQPDKTARMYYNCNIKESEAFVEVPLGCIGAGNYGSTMKCTKDGGVTISDCTDAKCSSCQHDYYIPPGCADWALFEEFLTCVDTEDSVDVPPHPHAPLPPHLRSLLNERVRQIMMATPTAANRR